MISCAATSGVASRPRNQRRTRSKAETRSATSTGFLGLTLAALRSYPDLARLYLVVADAAAPTLTARQAAVHDLSVRQIQSLSGAPDDAQFACRALVAAIGGMVSSCLAPATSTACRPCGNRSSRWSVERAQRSPGPGTCRPARRRRDATGQRQPAARRIAALTSGRRRGGRSPAAHPTGGWPPTAVRASWTDPCGRPPSGATLPLSH